MSVSVNISGIAKLNKVKDLLGAKTESEAVELALEKVIKEFEGKQTIKTLPDNFFEDLFAEETKLSECESVRAVVIEREESDF